MTENRVGYSGIWATTTEILAMSSLRQTDIVTYKQTTCPAQGASERPWFQWLPLKSCQLGKESLAEASIYLKNQDDVHFIVVTSLDKKKVWLSNCKKLISHVEERDVNKCVFIFIFIHHKGSAESNNDNTQSTIATTINNNNLITYIRYPYILAITQLTVYHHIAT